jgi:hypothetical protein
MPSDSIEKIAEDIYSFLAARFPVCCASDEFVFFPQALPDEQDWTRWDDFSSEAVEDAVLSLKSFRGRITTFREKVNNQSSDGHVNGSLLHWITEVLEEQLDFVSHHTVQPTFILTLATMGLVQALQSQTRNALRDRLSSLPGLLQRLQKALVVVPDLYREMGIEMALEFGHWIRAIGKKYDTGPILEKIDSLLKTLTEIPTSNDFRLGTDLLERTVSYHTGSGLNIHECLLELEDEIVVTEKTLQREADRMDYGQDWESAFANIRDETIPDGDKARFLQNEIRRLRDHCRREGLPGPEPADGESIVIEPLPDSLRSVRAADAYSARPGYPFRGGVFYIFGDGGLGYASKSIHPVYRMTAAHESYPGHHLLDMCRWNSSDRVRRPVEYPLFYEGWACFGEDLMLNTGAFDRDYDRLILARRRHRHAVRGKVDLLLHRGDLDLDSAAHELTKAGFSKDRARATARKYALRPSYQMCYTVGRRRFQTLFDLYRGQGTGSFTRTVLEQGEILFEDLENVLEMRNGQGSEGRE